LFIENMTKAILNHTNPEVSKDAFGVLPPQVG